MVPVAKSNTPCGLKSGQEERQWGRTRKEVRQFGPPCEKESI